MADPGIIYPERFTIPSPRSNGSGRLTRSMANAAAITTSTYGLVKSNQPYSLFQPFYTATDQQLLPPHHHTSTQSPSAALTNASTSVTSTANYPSTIASSASATSTTSSQHQPSHARRMTRSFNKQQQQELADAAAQAEKEVIVIEDSPVAQPPLPMNAPVTRRTTKRKRQSIVSNSGTPVTPLAAITEIPQPLPKRARRLSPKTQQIVLPPPAPPIRQHQKLLVPKLPIPSQEEDHRRDIQVQQLQVSQIESDFSRLQHARARCQRVEWMVDFAGCLRAKNVGVHVVYESAIALKKQQAPAKIDDEDGHYVVTPGHYLTSRYKVIRLLGQGTYGKVVQCYDTTDRRTLAIKVIRSVQKYRDASRIELRVLSTILEHDPMNKFKLHSSARLF